MNPYILNINSRTKNSYNRERNGKYKIIVERTYSTEPGDMIERLEMLKSKENDKIDEFYESIGDKHII